MTGARVRLWGTALALLAACGGESGPNGSSVEDRWSGTFSDGGVAYILTLTLTETEGAVAGTGTFTRGSDAIAMEATGTYVSPTVSLNLTATGFQNLNYTGTVEELVIRGRLNGSGFLNTLVNLDRQ